MKQKRMKEVLVQQQKANGRWVWGLCVFVCVCVWMCMCTFFKKCGVEGDTTKFFFSFPSR